MFRLQLLLGAWLLPVAVALVDDPRAPETDDEDGPVRVVEVKRKLRPLEVFRREHRYLDRDEWVAFDETEAQRLAGEGRMVFVDVTADWCVTCKAIERLVLETSDVADAFEKHGVVAMKADWTNRNDAITAFLKRHGKAAVPFYVLYRPGQDPYAFGEVVTKKSLLAALDEASAVASLP